MTLLVFVCDSENDMCTNCLGIIFLENLISVTSNNVFRIDVAIISGWSVEGSAVNDFLLCTQMCAKLSKKPCAFALVCLQARHVYDEQFHLPSQTCFAEHEPQNHGAHCQEAPVGLRKHFHRFLGGSSQSV